MNVRKWASADVPIQLLVPDTFAPHMPHERFAKSVPVFLPLRAILIRINSVCRKEPRNKLICRDLAAFRQEVGYMGRSPITIEPHQHLSTQASCMSAAKAERSVIA